MLYLHDLKVKEYKCFKGYQGFDEVNTSNVIIGRNNTGKSSLLDLIELLIKEDERFTFQYTVELPEHLIRQFLNEHTFGGQLNGNHWNHGKLLINVPVTVEHTGNTKKCVKCPKNVEYIFETSYGKNIISHLKNPLLGYRLLRLRAERDIRPESHYSIINTKNQSPVKENGEGATNLIQNFINHVQYNRDLVEHDLLDKLNEIMHPDAQFSDIVVQLDESGAWEIFLEEGQKGIIPLSQSGSGLKTVILVLIYLLLLPEHFKVTGSDIELDHLIFAFEELENNLHPALQRRLFYFIHKYAEMHGLTVFYTTHSNVVIDMFSSLNHASLFHVSSDELGSKVRKINEFVDKLNILNDLDIRASDLLQTNGIVWVEGPSDRIYFNRWIDLYSGGQLKDGIHYQCLFYGGRLLSHLTANVENEKEDFINILKTNHNAIIIIDSDKRSKNSRINQTKKRICGEMEKIGALCWITKGKEVENYIPSDALSKYLNRQVPAIGQYELLHEYLDTIKSGLGKTFQNNKVKFASEIIPFITKENQGGILDLEHRIKECISRIKKWNKLD